MGHSASFWSRVPFCAGGMVGEGMVELHTVELALRMLIKAAEANIATMMSWHGLPPGQRVTIESKTFGEVCQEIEKRTLS